MAAHSNNFIRVRLHFDYAPPAAISCRMCWLLVDLNTCRVVSDLESLIRQKFELSRRSILSLFVEDCYLPHTESIYVVRDNDCVRVKVDSVAQVTGQGTSPGSLKENGRKRQRPEEERQTELENGFELKKKKRKKHQESPKKDGEQQMLSEEKKKKKQKEKKKREQQEKDPAAPSKPAPTAKKNPVEERSKSSKKPPVAQLSKQNASSSESSSSSEEDVPPKKAPTPKPPTKTPAAPSKPASTAKTTTVTVEQSKSIKKPSIAQLRKQNVSSSDFSSSSEEDVPPNKTPTPKPSMKTPDASKKPPNNNSTVKNAPPLSSSSSDSDSSSNEAVGNKRTPINALLTSTVANGKINMSLESTACAQGPAALPPDSSSEDEIKLVIHRPVRQLGGMGAGGLPPRQGRGRGKARRGRGGGAFRGRGFELNYHGDNNEPYSGDSQTNVSVVLQNAEQTSPKKDYSSMPLLAAPPQVGQNIAFKLLELTENYTPEVSEYKEAKIVAFDPTTNQIELELQNTAHAPIEPGKFDLVYQNPDGSERVEYAVARSSRITEYWDTLLEPRLII